jgi:hypothetical protein
MAEKKKQKHKKPRRVRKERRFVADTTQSSRISVGAGMLGALALGAGVYGLWIRDPALGYAQYMVAGGALVLGASLWFGDTRGDPLRVGDAGVALEHGAELTRIAWCEMQRVSIAAGKLVIEGEDHSFEVPVAAHRPAVSYILKELVSRVPDALDVKSSEGDKLPEPKESDGELVPVENVQVAGKHCAASETPISFERDARLCPNCAAVYHKDHVPKKCVTCDEQIAGRAYQP